MKIVVGVADMKISSTPGDTIVTYGLGSCLGVVVHDRIAAVGGLLHVMMPQSSINPDKAKSNPWMFVDTAIPLFFHEIYRAGGVKHHLVVKVAGGANVQNRLNDRFTIGKRNYTAFKKMLWRNGVLIDVEDVGGYDPRTVSLEIGTGRAWLNTAGCKKRL